MSFADIEVRATASVFKGLSNALATFASQVDPVPVVFDAAAGRVDDIGIETLGPSLTMIPDQAPLIAEGSDLTISAPALQIMDAPYRIRGIEPLAEGGFQRVNLVRLP